jgi:hypothetical protein
MSNDSNSGSSAIQVPAPAGQQPYQTSSPGTAVLQTQGPSWQQPYQAKGLEYAQNMLNMGAPQQYGGQTVVPFSGQTERAMQGIEQRALAGSPLVNQATQYAQNQLAGTPTSSFGSQSNPYLDQMFQRAATNSRSQLEGEFARAGRNVNAAAPIRGQQLNDLATQFYGSTYENNQQRALSDILSQRGQQGQALGMVGQLAEQPYLDMQRLGSVGASVEDLAGRVQQDQRGRFDYEQRAPQVLLDQYLARVNGNLGQSTYEPSGGTNKTAGTVGGALTGAALGSQFSDNGWAALLGALGGGILGRKG